MPYLAAGYDVFILRYSVGENAVWPNPLEDYESAFAYILSRAEEWKILKDKIAVVGFSAGGHLAASAATMAEHRPAAAILGYPVIREDTVHECEPTAPGIPEHVDENTCPCFLFASRTDNVVPIQNALDMMEALNRFQISFECHIYAFGPHGYSTGDTSIQAFDTAMPARAADWVRDSVKWLRNVMGEFGYNGLMRPVCKARVSDDQMAWLSIDCTLGRIFGNPAAVSAIAPLVDVMREKIEPFTPEMGFEDMLQLMSKMTLRDVLTERHIWQERFEEIDSKLREVPNI